MRRGVRGDGDVIASRRTSTRKRGRSGDDGIVPFVLSESEHVEVECLLRHNKLARSVFIRG
jgi:hypothetical protein